MYLSINLRIAANGPNPIKKISSILSILIGSSIFFQPIRELSIKAKFYAANLPYRISPWYSDYGSFDKEVVS